MKHYIFKSAFLKRIVIPYSLLVVIMTTMFACILYYLVNIRHKDDLQIFYDELSQKTIVQIDSMLNEMDNVALRVRSDSSMVIFLTELYQSEDSEGNYFEKNILQSIDVGSVLATINKSGYPMWRISIYNSKGDFISTGASVEEDTVNVHLINSNVPELMINLKYNQIITSFSGGDNWSNLFKSKYISILRPIMSEYTGTVYAVVEIQQDIKELEKRLKNDNKTAYVIYDSDNKIVTSSIPLEELADKELVSKARSEKYGWSVEYYDIAGNNMNIILATFILLYITVIGLVFMLTYKIADGVAEPLRTLRKSVKKVSSGNITLQTNEHAIDEIKELGDVFTDVLLRMNESASAERKALSLAMQSQVNPHFIFNILSVISSKGMEANNDEIVTMCQQVSDMLRYVSDFEDTIVPIRDEIVHTKNYLDLMKARYEDYFVYEIDIDPNDDINNVCVPKLILQPLVENCFKHAFKECEPVWKVWVSGKSDGKTWSITVKDNGNGFSDEQLHTLRSKIDGFRKNIKSNYKDLSIGGLGLLSTVARLQLTGSKVEYDIQTGKNGTEITISGEIIQGEN